MYLEDIQAYVVGRNEVTIQGAINSVAAAPNSVFVIIPAGYSGTDAYTNASGVSVLDLRPAAQNPNWAGGQPVVVGRASALSLVANAAAANIAPVIPPAGVYRVSIYIVNTAAFTTAGALVTVGYTDAAQAQSQATAATAIGSGAIVAASLIVETAGLAPITYAVSSAGVWGAANVYVVLERLA